MKKKSIFGKKQVVLAGLVLALAAAVWLNTTYSTGAGGFVNTQSVSSAKNLGDTQYVINETDGETAQTNAEAESDYFTTARAEREASRKEAIAILKETVENVKSSEEDKTKANEKLGQIALNTEKETAIENLKKDL